MWTFKNENSCYILVTLILLTFVTFNPVECEIHRARSLQQTFKHRFRNVEDLELELNPKLINQETPDPKSKVFTGYDSPNSPTDSKPSDPANSWSEWLDGIVLGHSRRIWLYSSVSSGLVGMTGLFPLLVIPMNCGGLLKSKATTKRLNMLLSFAVGGLLGDVFLHLLPEAWAHAENYGGKMVGYRNIGTWFLVGLLSFFFIEKLAGEEEDDEEEEDEDEDEKEESDGRISEENDEIILGPIKMVGLKKNDDDASGDFRDGGGKPGFAKLIREERSDRVNCINRLDRKKKLDQKGMNEKQQNGYHNQSPSSSQSPPPSSSSSSSSSSPSSSSSVAKKEGHIKVSGWLNLLANVVDNFTHGLAVAGSFCISPKMGLLTTLAILLHEIPHEIGDFAILLQSGFDRWRAAKAQVLTASGGIIGAMIALSADSVKSAGDSTAWILPFTAGGFINIALVAIVPDLMKERGAKSATCQVLLVCTGIFVMGLVTALVD